MTAVILALVGSVYALTLTDCLTEDSVDYACAAVKGGLAQLLHPHHLIYNPLLALWSHEILQGGADAESLLSFQCLNIFISLVSLLLLALTLNELGFSMQIQMGSVLAFAFAHGFWSYSSQIEVYNGATLCILGALHALIRETRASKIFGPIFLILGMLFHQTVIFFCLAICIYAVTGLGLRKSLSILRLYGAIPLAAVGLCYAGATLAALRTLSPSAVFEFMTSYAHSGWWGELQKKTWWLGPRGLLDSVLAVDALKKLALSWPGLAAEAALVGTVCLLLFTGEKTLVAIDGKKRSLLVLCGIWSIAHASFVLWWYPDNIEFWIILLPALTIGGAIFLETFVHGSRRRLAILSSVLLLELLVNATQWRQGCEDAKRDREYAKSLCIQSRPIDLVLTSGQGALGSWLRYFCPSSVISIHGYFGMKKPKPNEDVTSRLIDALEPQIEVALDRGGKVWIEASLWNGSIAKNRDLEHFDLSEFESWLHGHPARQESVGALTFHLLERP
jgi:hypothetical protein